MIITIYHSRKMLVAATNIDALEILICLLFTVDGPINPIQLVGWSVGHTWKWL